MLLCSVASKQTIFLHSFHTSPPHIRIHRKLISQPAHQAHTQTQHTRKKNNGKAFTGRRHWLPPSRTNCQKKGDGHITMQQSIKS